MFRPPVYGFWFISFGLSLSPHVCYTSPCAAIALLLTALLAIAGYILQNKNAADAIKVQHEVVQEAAVREKAETKAGKLLERVQLQNKDFVYPVQHMATHFCHSYDQAVLECGMEAFMAIYGYDWFQPPTQPHVTLNNHTNIKDYKAIAQNPFKRNLPPEDLARLVDDPVRRERWQELVTHTMLPPLRP